MTVDEAPVDRIEVLAREVRAARNALLSAIDTRLRHPTYGVTKQDIRERWMTLRGLAAGYAIMCGESSAMIEILAKYGLDKVAGAADSFTYKAVQFKVMEALRQGR